VVEYSGNRRNNTFYDFIQRELQ